MGRLPGGREWGRCAGERHLQEMHPESHGFHTRLLLLGPGPQGGRGPLKAACAPCTGIVPCFFLGLGACAENLCTP